MAKGKQQYSPEQERMIVDLAVQASRAEDRYKEAAKESRERLSEWKGLLKQLDDEINQTTPPLPLGG
jgi:hypothetical protein